MKVASVNVTGRGVGEAVYKFRRSLSGQEFPDSKNFPSPDIALVCFEMEF